MGNEGGGTGDTQESASAGPDCLEDYNSQHASQATPSFLVPVLDERVGGRGRSNMKLEFFDWRKLGLLSAFFGCDWQGAPRALIFFFFWSSGGASAGGASVSTARARRARARERR